MKAFAVLVILVAGGIAATYHFGGFTSLDPAAQAEALLSSVKPGMTWEQVADIHEPRQIHPLDDQTFTGEAQPIDFNRANLGKMIANGGVADGFLYKYHFSEAHAVGVTFDRAGKVISVDKLRTTADLFTLPGG